MHNHRGWLVYFFSFYSRILLRQMLQIRHAPTLQLAKWEVPPFHKLKKKLELLETPYIMNGGNVIRTYKGKMWCKDKVSSPMTRHVNIPLPWQSMITNPVAPVSAWKKNICPLHLKKIQLLPGRTSLPSISYIKLRIVKISWIVFIMTQSITANK